MRALSVPIYALSQLVSGDVPYRCQSIRMPEMVYGVLLSGQVKVLKPDRRIFEIFLDTFRIERVGPFTLTTPVKTSNGCPVWLRGVVL